MWRNIQILAAVITVLTGALALVSWLDDDDEAVVVVYVNDKYIIGDKYYLVGVGGERYRVTKAEYFSVLRWKDGRQF